MWRARGSILVVDDDMVIVSSKSPAVIDPARGDYTVARIEDRRLFRRGQSAERLALGGARPYEASLPRRYITSRKSSGLRYS
jgi:hypothetical protein